MPSIRIMVAWRWSLQGLIDHRRGAGLADAAGDNLVVPLLPAAHS